jgi:hypothetical protein
MKVLALICALVAALVLFSLHDGARAEVTGVQSQKGPGFYRLTANDSAAEKACKDKSGTVSTDQDGYKICTLPRACPGAGGPTRTTKLDADDPAAAKKCQDTCGIVSTDNGAKVCTKPEGY